MDLNYEMKLQEWSSRPFLSSEAEQAAFADPLYKTSADYRAAVAAKCAVSTNGIQSKVYNDSRTIEVIRDSETTGHVATADEQLAALNGPLSVKPAGREKAQKEIREEHSQWANAERVNTSVRNYSDE